MKERKYIKGERSFGVGGWPIYKILQEHNPNVYGRYIGEEYYFHCDIYYTNGYIQTQILDSDTILTFR